MLWYYAPGGDEQRGPLEAEELRALIAQAKVRRTDLAWREGMPKWRPIGKLKELRVQTPFFAVSLTKLVVMTVVTIGLYEFFWFYKQWSAVKRRDREDLWPWARALFAPIWCFWLADEIADECRAAGIGDPNAPKAIGAFYLIANIGWKLPSAWYLIGFVTVVPLMLMQDDINDLHAKVVPGADRNARFTVWNIVMILSGGALLALAIAGMIVN